MGPLFAQQESLQWRAKNESRSDSKRSTKKYAALDIAPHDIGDFR
jgi:hypothetical protein